MANLLRVRTVVQQTLARQDAERTNQFLHAASSGDVAKIRQVSSLTPSPASCLGKSVLPFCQDFMSSKLRHGNAFTLALACAVLYSHVCCDDADLAPWLRTAVLVWHLLC